MATTLLTSRSFPVPLDLHYHSCGKRVSIRFHPLKRAFVVHCPKGSSLRKIETFVEKHAASMERYMSALPTIIPLTYGSIIPVLGEEHIISKYGMSENSAFPTLAIPAIESRSKPLIIATLRSILQCYIQERLDMLLATPVFEAIKKTPVFCLRDLVSRWGSCSSDGKMMFSWRLVFAPRHVLDYVIAHECAHLLHHDHSEAFWHTTHSLHADISIAKTWLKQYHFILFSYH